jgi:hypothetical protein
MTENTASADRFVYERRKVTADSVVAVQGCLIKPYRVSYPAPQGEAEVAAFDMPALIARALPTLDGPAFHDLGFAIVHQGRDGAYLLLARWHGGHNLGSATYGLVDESGGIPGLVRLPLLACIWELAIYAHERDAWVRTMMVSGHGLAGAHAYLACRLEGHV